MVFRPTRQYIFFLCRIVVVTTSVVCLVQADNEQDLVCSTDKLYLTQIGLFRGAVNDYFGNYVSLSKLGDILAVGATHGDGNGTNSGYVRVYERDGNHWIQRGSTINGEHEGDQCGPNALSGDGSIIAVGATHNDDMGENTGQVRMFQYDGIDWEQMGSTFDGLEEQDQFGYGLALSDDGTFLAVGANGQNGINSEGQVRVFQWNHDIKEWEQVGKTITGQEEFAYLHQVSLSQDGFVLAVGEPQSNFAGNDAGCVRIFKILNDDWEQIGQSLCGYNAEDRFGSSIALSADGTVVTIGASPSSNDDKKGYVMAYSFQNKTWLPRGNVLLSDSPGNDFANSIALSGNGNILVIGAANSDVNGINSGHVQVFYFADDWMQIFDNIEGQQPHQFLGRSVAVSKDGLTFVIGGDGSIFHQVVGIVNVFHVDCASDMSTTEPTEPVVVSTNPPHAPTNIPLTEVPTDYTASLDTLSTSPGFFASTTVPTNLPQTEVPTDYTSFHGTPSTAPAIFVSTTFVDVFIEFVGAKKMSEIDTRTFERLTAAWYDEFFAKPSFDLDVYNMSAYFVVTNQTLTGTGNKVMYDQTIAYVMLRDDIDPKQYIYLPFFDLEENAKYGGILRENLRPFTDLELPVPIPQIAMNQDVTENSASTNQKSRSNTILIVGITVAISLILIIATVVGTYCLIKRRSNSSQQAATETSNNPDPTNADQVQNHERTDEKFMISTEEDGPDFKHQTQSVTAARHTELCRIIPPAVQQRESVGFLLGDDLPNYKDQVRNSQIAFAEAIPFDS